jgi:hypothetical protein
MGYTVRLCLKRRRGRGRGRKRTGLCRPKPHGTEEKQVSRNKIVFGFSMKYTV